MKDENSPSYIILGKPFDYPFDILATSSSSEGIHLLTMSCSGINLHETKILPSELCDREACIYCDCKYCKLGEE